MTIFTCRSAPSAMPPMAVAISLTARPASSEVCAICAAAAFTFTAVSRICAITPASVSRVSL